MPREDYEERREARIDRLDERANRAQRESNALYQQSKRMMDAIPMGQPILIGHHSEKRDRNFRNRAWNKLGKAVELSDKAEHLKRRASSARGNRVISSDDPEALIKLREKIDKAEKVQNIMKRANKIVRGKPKNERTPQKIEALTELLGKETMAEKLFVPDFCGRIGFPDYAMTNNNSNIRRMKQRLAGLEKEFERQEDAENTVTEYNGFSVIENVEENRIQIDFPSKQAYFELCKSKGINLRREGFKFAKSTGMWQRLLNNSGRYAARCVAEMIASKN